MQHSPQPTAMEPQGPAAARTDPTGAAQSGHAVRCALTVRAEREMRAPIAALRVLLEGARPGAARDLGPQFVDRAIAELDRAERAAKDLLTWTAPRAVRASSCSLGAIVQSLRETLDPGAESRCQFLVEAPTEPLHTDGRLLVEALARTILATLETGHDPRAEIMVHAHCDSEWATVSLVEAAVEIDPSRDHCGDSDDPGRGDAALAETLLTREAHRLGGRASLHTTDGHRCYVVVIPRSIERTERDAA